MIQILLNNTNNIKITNITNNTNNTNITNNKWKSEKRSVIVSQN